MMTELLAFLGVSALVICTPGPDTALTVRNSIIGGRRAGVLTAAGIAAGQLVWTVAASVGIAGLLQASQPAFLALKIAGAAYLILTFPLFQARDGSRSSRPRSDPMSEAAETPITVTSAAAARILFVTSDEPEGTFMRISVSGGGCSGGERGIGMKPFALDQAEHG